MKRLTRKFNSLSAATLVICVTIVVSSAVTATAAKLITGKQIKNSSITAADIKNKSLTGSDIKDATIAKADLKSDAFAAGPQGPQGPAGASGADGTARAYAQVNPAGGSSLVTARTKGFSSVSRIATGIYCLQLSDSSINPDSFPAVATVEFGNTGSPGGETVQVRGSNASIPDACAAGQYVIRTFDETNALADTVAFTMLVP